MWQTSAEGYYVTSNVEHVAVFSGENVNTYSKLILIVITRSLTLLQNTRCHLSLAFLRWAIFKEYVCTATMGGATWGGGYGGQCPPPPLLGPAGYRGYRVAVQWKWSLLLQQTVFIQYCRSDWISTPLTLVDTCQVNESSMRLLIYPALFQNIPC